MGNLIPEETVEQIRKSMDIVDVISEYVQLKKQGRNYFGLCPFHGENTPSFSVSQDKQIYHCFGCGAGGNAFSFVMDIEGISFVDVLRKFAARTGTPLSIAEPTKKADESVRMIEAHELLKKLYHHLLLNTKEGEAALQYLLSRGLTKEMMEAFEIGFAPPLWDFTTNFLRSKGVEDSIAEAAGLIIRKDDGMYFDRFRGRVMFPIHDHQGVVVAFSGRDVVNQEPKYLNSPETLIFNKGKLLYHFHQARTHIRKYQRALLMEGFLDVIAAEKSGIPYAFATMGTSLTEEQARIIRRNVESVIICYDGDRPGISATLRAAEILQQVGCIVKVAVLPNGLDPDEYVKKYGTERFKSEIIDSCATVTTFKLMYLRQQKNVANEGERLEYIEDALKELRTLENVVELDMHLRQIADEFSLSLEALRERLNKYRMKKAKTADVKEPIATKRFLKAFQNAERIIIAHMLQNEEIAEKVKQEVAGRFNIEEHQTIAFYLYAFYEEGHKPNIGIFLERINDPEIQKLIVELSLLNIPPEPSELRITDAINVILHYPNELEERHTDNQVKETEKFDPFQAALLAQENLNKKIRRRGTNNG